MKIKLHKFQIVKTVFNKKRFVRRGRNKKKIIISHLPEPDQKTNFRNPVIFFRSIILKQNQLEFLESRPILDKKKIFINIERVNVR